jgi:hypothetical protein
VLQRPIEQGAVIESTLYLKVVVERIHMHRSLIRMHRQRDRGKKPNFFEV